MKARFPLIQQRFGTEAGWMLTCLTKANRAQTRGQLNLRTELKKSQTLKPPRDFSLHYEFNTMDTWYLLVVFVKLCQINTMDL